MNHAKAIRIRELIKELTWLSIQMVNDCRVCKDLDYQKKQAARNANRLTQQMLIEMDMLDILNDGFVVPPFRRGTFREKKK